MLLIVIAALLGFFIGKQVSSRANTDNAQKAQTEQLQAQFDQYKQDVEQHFSASADLLGNMAQEYNNVYKHMAQAQQSLLPDSDVTISIPFKEHKESSLVKEAIVEIEEQHLANDVNNMDSVQPNDYVQGTNNIIHPDVISDTKAST